VYVCFGSFVKCSRVSAITFGSDTSYSNLQRSSTRLLQERSLNIGRLLKSVNLIQSSLNCRSNVEQFNWEEC
jgi:hypothetical protein